LKVNKEEKHSIIASSSRNAEIYRNKSTFITAKFFKTLSQCADELQWTVSSTEN